MFMCVCFLRFYIFYDLQNICRDLCTKMRKNDKDIVMNETWA